MQRASELGAGNFQPSFPGFHDELIELRAARAAADARQRQLLVAMTAFCGGDFSVRLPADWEGVDARIADAFNHALAHNDRISREISRLSANVGKEGRLRQRMSLPGAMGGWTATAESLNTLIDDLVRPTTEIARTIGA